MKIYLGDLGHYTVKLTNNHTPINLGFIAAYAKSLYKENVEIKLYKNPDHLIKALDSNPPDILGLSNYMWCQSASEDMFRYYKKVKKDGIAVWGGPNFPMNELHKAKQYLMERPFVDFYIPFEGEIPFSKILGTALEHGNNVAALKSQHAETFEGSYFLYKENELIGKNIGVQLKELDVVPSPYLGGWMDDFMREGLHPMFETQRGCPYQCTFCHTGLSYYNRGRSFSLDRCKEEIEYIIKAVPDATKAHLYITDSNFGMWPQDLEFTKYLKKRYDETGFPLSFGTSTGKGRINLVLDTVMNHPKLNLTNSVQSLDDKVLKIIKRRNLPLNELQHSQHEVDIKGKLSHPEVILGLPGETKESHIETMRKLVCDVGAIIIYQYTLMLLPGTEIYTDKLRDEFNYMVRYRVLPTQFGEYAGKKCFEIEEVSVATKDLSFPDYLEMRELFFIVHNVHSNKVFRPINLYLSYLGLDVIEFYLFLMKERKSLGNQFPNQVIEDYMRDTQKELFETKEELIEYYSKEENYKQLLSGKEGYNLTHSYRAQVLVNCIEWTEFVLSSFTKFMNQKCPGDSGVLDVIDSINNHIKAQAECQFKYFRKMSNIPSKNNPVIVDLNYDISSIFSRKIDKVEYPTLPKDSGAYSYYMRDDAIKYITSFNENLTKIDFAVMLLRIDLQYLFPVCERKRETVEV